MVTLHSRARGDPARASARKELAYRTVKRWQIEGVTVLGAGTSRAFCFVDVTLQAVCSRPVAYQRHAE